MQLFQAFRKKTCRKAELYPVKEWKRIESLKKFLQNIFHQSVPIET